MMIYMLNIVERISWLGSDRIANACAASKSDCFAFGGYEFNHNEDYPPGTQFTKRFNLVYMLNPL